MDAPDPLTELLAHLERDGDVPLSWIVAHAPDGDLRRVWETCPDLAPVWRLATAVASRQRVIVAACAAVRGVLDFAATGAPQLAAAIAAAEAWAARVPPSDAFDADLFEHANAAWDVYYAATARGDARTKTVADAVGRVVGGAAIGEDDLTDARAKVSEGVEAVGRVAVVRALEGRSKPLPRRTLETLTRRARAALLPVIRAQLSCPTLDQLRTAYRRG